MGERWRPIGVIDFGDAMVGDRLYELVALNLGLFRCDKRLLGIFLDTYGFDLALRRDFVRRAMSLTLLHEFNVLSSVLPCVPRRGTSREPCRTCDTSLGPGAAGHPGDRHDEVGC